jgi:hypothetical protein
MTKKKRNLIVLLVLSAGAVLAVCAGFYLPYKRNDGINISRDGFDRIVAGMTVNEVEEIIGGPPGVYYRGMYMEFSELAPTQGDARESEESSGFWQSEEALIAVKYDSEGRVKDKVFTRMHDDVFLVRWLRGLFR